MHFHIVCRNFDLICIWRHVKTFYYISWEFLFPFLCKYFPFEQHFLAYVNHPRCLFFPEFSIIYPHTLLILVGQPKKAQVGLSQTRIHGKVLCGKTFITLPFSLEQKEFNVCGWVMSMQSFDVPFLLYCLEVLNIFVPVFSFPLHLLTQHSKEERGKTPLKIIYLVAIGVSCVYSTN